MPRSSVFSPVRIAIVDDHEIVRRGFKELLADEPGFEVVLDTSSGDVLMEALRNDGCDLVLLDISLSGESGVDVLRAIRQRFDNVGVLILSGFPEHRDALPMIRNGANGYLCKDCEPEELIAALRSVARATFRQERRNCWPARWWASTNLNRTRNCRNGSCRCFCAWRKAGPCRRSANRCT